MPRSAPLVLVLACSAQQLGCGGAPPRPSWIEQDLGDHHDSGAARAGDSDPLDAGGAPAEPAAGSGPDPRSEGATSAVGLGEVTAALAALRAAPGAASSKARLARAVAAVSAGDVADLERLALAQLERPGGPRLALLVARLWAHGRAYDRAAPLLLRAAEAVGRTPVATDADLVLQVRELTAALATAGAGGEAVRPLQVAVLLPLSGRFAAVGQELRGAIELAAATAPTVRWLFLDTRGQPEQAAAMVEQATAAGAVAILGPAGDREAIAAARRAAQRGVPLALLAPGDGADLSLGVLRLGWSPQDEARAVAEWAAANDFSSVAVLAPRDDVGELAATAFSARAAALGLTVAAQGRYDAVGGSVEADLKRFLNLVPERNPRLAAHLRRGGKRAWQSFVPDVGFSLLYVPDRAERAALVAAFLPYLGVELRTEEIMDPLRLRRKYRGAIPQVVQLVGGSGWNVPALPARGGAAVQGAIIIDVCSAQRDDLAAELAIELAARLGHPPSSAAAQAYDAARWLAAAVTLAAGRARSDDRPARERLRVALSEIRIEEGACGGLHLAPDGEVVREPVFLQVDGEELVLAP